MGNETSHTTRCFVSHSHEDKNFVRQLVDDLKHEGLDIFFDEYELYPGDSIVQKISQAISECDYFIVVLSRASVKSKWVMAELDAALMEQYSNEGVLVVPVLKEESEVPVLLRSRVWADFRSDYTNGFSSLLEVLKIESLPVEAYLPSRGALLGVVGSEGEPRERPCEMMLASLNTKIFTRLLNKRMSRNEVGEQWFYVLEVRMEDHMPGRPKLDCLIELILRARERGRVEDLILNLCEDRPDLINVTA